MLAACTTHIPLKKIPARVIVIRDGQRLHNPPKPIKTKTTPPGTTTAPSGITPPPPKPESLFLQVGDQISVRRPGALTFTYDDNRYRIPHGSVTLKCSSLRIGTTTTSPATGALAVDLKSGQVNVRSASHARRALVLSPEMLAFATVPNSNFVVDRNPAGRSTRASTLNKLIVAAKASDQALRINTRITYTAISDAHGIRLDIWPFSLSPLQRLTTSADGLPPYWADGLPCSVGCTPPGVTPGWPLKPFHRQHAIRAGINELRGANFHVAVDIQAENFQPVYAIQSGHNRSARGGDDRALSRLVDLGRGVSVGGRRRGDDRSRSLARDDRLLRSRR